jgi:hypothetical protein
MSDFFHTLVVFGAGASLAGCGAKVIGEEGAEHSGPHGGQETMDGGVTSVGAGGHFAGMGGAVGTGGVVSTGGVPASGGATGAAGVPIVESVTAQWNCAGLWSGCAYVMTAAGAQTAFALSGACPVDPARPRSEADCAAGEQFECVRATLGGAELIVDCLCVPARPDGSCDYVCAFRASGSAQAVDGACNGRTKLCGCFTGILR